MLAVGFFITITYQVEDLAIPSLLRVLLLLLWMDIGFCQLIGSYDLSLQLVDMINCINWLSDVELVGIPKINLLSQGI